MSAARKRPAWVAELCHECYAAHYILTNLGFEPGEVFVGVQTLANTEPPGSYAIIKLVHDGRSFVLHLRPMSETDAKEFEPAWHAFVEAKPRMSHGDLDRIVRATWVWHERESLLVALVAKGFELRPGAMVN